MKQRTADEVNILSNGLIIGFALGFLVGMLLVRLNTS